MTIKSLVAGLVAPLFVSSLTACQSPTQILSSWRDPNVTIANPSLHKIVVAALLHDQGVRRTVEDYMVTLYPGVATQSYKVLGGDSLLLDEAAANQKLTAEGYDGVVIMKQVNSDVTEHFVPGGFPEHYHRWGGYWGPAWGSAYYAPGHVHNDWHWVVQVNVYALPKNTLIWSADTRTTDPGGRVPLFEDVCNAVRAQMRADGFLK